ncbi:MAG: Rieske 2Fe-2S domain-containing protein [Candidatus Limnocylindrales bacterium]
MHDDDPPRRPSISAYALLPLRFFFGATFLYAGIDKLILDRGFFDPASPTSIQAQFTIFERVSPLAPLVHLVEPLAPALGVLIALGEIGAGLGALTGLGYRLAALGGALLSFLFFLTASWATHPYYFGNDLPYALGWLTLALAGHANLYVLRLARNAPTDEPIVLAGRRLPHAVGRRLVLQVGGLSVLTLGLGSLLGAMRWLTPVASAGDGTGGPVGRPSPGPSSTPQATFDGVAIANVADFDAHPARRFTVPISAPAPLPAGDPAIVIKMDDGSFVAYDALCTHEGCRVGYDTVAAVIYCPCHGAEFDPADHASVLAGPTNIPLAELPLVVDSAAGTVVLRYS